MREIFLSQGQVAKIDDEDFDAVSPYRWYLNRKGAMGRPVRAVRTERGYTELAMVRTIFPQIQKGQTVRYKNGDATDLRRENVILPAANVGKAPKAIAKAPHPLARGAVAELAIAADLFRHGLEVFMPVHGYSCLDMICFDGESRTYRVQVKSGTSAGGKLRVTLENVTTTNSGVKRRPLRLDSIDLFALHDNRTGQIAYLSPSQLRTRASSITLLATPMRQVSPVDHRRTPLLAMADLTNPWAAISRNIPEAVDVGDGLGVPSEL